MQVPKQLLDHRNTNWDCKIILHTIEYNIKSLNNDTDDILFVIFVLNISLENKLLLLHNSSALSSDLVVSHITTVPDHYLITLPRMYQRMEQKYEVTQFGQIISVRQSTGQ